MNFPRTLKHLGFYSLKLKSSYKEFIDKLNEYEFDHLLIKM